MKKIVIPLVLASLLGALVYGAARHHVVRTEKGTIVLSKRFMTCADLFVDARGWASADYEAHPELRQAMVDQGYGDILAELAARERKATFDTTMGKAGAMADELATKMTKTVKDLFSTTSAPPTDR